MTWLTDNISKAIYILIALLILRKCRKRFEDTRASTIYLEKKYAQKASVMLAELAITPDFLKGEPQNHTQTSWHQVYQKLLRASHD